MRLNGKNVLITGGSSGIGLETAKLFIQNRARVAITGRDKSKLDGALAELGSNAIGYVADAGNQSNMERVAAEVSKQLGPIHVLFANAGIGLATPLGKTSAQLFEHVIQTNLTGVFFSVQAVVPHMTSGGAVILNSSVHAVMGAPYFSAYAASKGAVRSMSRVLAAELASLGIRVNVVTPGAATTPIWNSVAPSAEALASLTERISQRIPQGRFGAPLEIANAVLFLASDDSSHITAAEIVVDGGASGAPSGAPVFRT